VILSSVGLQGYSLQGVWIAEVFVACRHPAAVLADEFAVFDDSLVILQIGLQESKIVQIAQMLIMSWMGHFFISHFSFLHLIEVGSIPFLHFVLDKFTQYSNTTPRSGFITKHELGRSP
jgi:hypothetical protein